ncbi:MAG TPA: ERF family protein [Chryseolinea sp.]
MAKDKVVEGKVVGKEKPSKALATVQPVNAEGLIAQAIDKGTSIETMEKLMAMRKEMKAEWAKEQFDSALSAFQSDCPIIKKRKKVMNKDGRSVRYTYAPLDDIVEQVKPFLKVHGFSYTIDVPVEDGFITSVVTLTHKDGHSKTSSFRIPIDKDSYMNAQQQFASALTFGKRYAFCNALGVLTGDEDDDAQTAPQSAPAKKNGLELIKESLGRATLAQAEEFKQKIFDSKKYTDPEKEKIIALADERIAELNGEPTQADLPN